MKYWVKNVEKYNSCFSNNKNDGQYRNCWVDLIKIQTLEDTKNVKSKRYKATNDRSCL